MKIIAIIQARVGSTRLPGKVLVKLQGKTVLEHVVHRVAESRLITQIVVATTTKKEDTLIANLCNRKNIPVFCGSETDVLDRYYQAAKLYNADHVVRITADCPLIDARIIDRVIEKHLISKADYTSNTLAETFPDGEDAEVFSINTLQKTWQAARLVSEREHVTPYIKKHAEIFKIVSVARRVNLGRKRWTLDNPEDLDFIKKIYADLYPKNPDFDTSDVLSLLRRHPELEKINKHILRNEGYKKSLKRDKIYHAHIL